MKIVCPKDPSHKSFSVTAHEVHDWEVDEKGEVVKDLGYLEMSHMPTVGDLFTCLKCFTEAKVSD